LHFDIKKTILLAEIHEKRPREEIVYFFQKSNKK
jgi:hypothetical protein